MQQPADFRAPRVGADLRAARERLGWSLDDTSAYLRIRAPFLAALEEGRTADLPSPVYALAFVRSYAQALGVDVGEIVRRYQDEVGGRLPRTELAFPAPVARHAVPKGAVALLGAALAVAGYVGWYRVSGERADTVQVQQVPARLTALALPVVPVRPAAVASAVGPMPGPSLANAYQPSAIAPSTAEAAVPPASLAIQPAVVTPAGGTRLVLNATQDAWVEIKDGTGKVVLSKLMHAGDSWPVPDRPSGGAPMVMTTGNAGGTQIMLDGKALPALGADGVVRHDIALDPASIATASGG